MWTKKAKFGVNAFLGMEKSVIKVFLILRLKNIFYFYFVFFNWFRCVFSWKKFEGYLLGFLGENRF